MKNLLVIMLMVAGCLGATNASAKQSMVQKKDTVKAPPKKERPPLPPPPPPPPMPPRN